jgi:hypothetical protein
MKQYFYHNGKKIGVVGDIKDITQEDTKVVSNRAREMTKRRWYLHMSYIEMRKEESKKK